MESFFRYISYIDYYRNKERLKNVGFLRWKLQNGKHKIEIQLKDVNCPRGTYEIKEINTEKKLDEIEIDQGIGNYIKEFSSKYASKEMYIDGFEHRLYISDIKGLRIYLNDKEYLYASLELDKTESNINKVKKENYKIEKRTTEPESQKDSCETFRKVEEIQDAKAASENVVLEGIEEKYIDLKKENIIEILEPIYEDKWQQLEKKYPTVHPFSDKAAFLSIKPEDFIILQKEYQKLVHNSFLLHGFYNYGHMILGKLSEEKEAPIYVGVPGVYYEQEKKAAQMFGFVGFESVEHPVQQGSYGYYMIEVEI